MKPDRYFGATVMLYGALADRATAVITHHRQCRFVAKAPSLAAFMRIGERHGIRVERGALSETHNDCEMALVDEHGPILRGLNAWRGGDPLVALEKKREEAGRLG